MHPEFSDILAFACGDAVTDALRAHMEACSVCARLCLTCRPHSAEASALQELDRGLYVDWKPLEQGGMGCTSTALDRRLGRRVVIKVPRPERAGDAPGTGEFLRARLIREARIASSLQHPSVVSVFECGYFPDGQPFFAMELIEGRSLQQLVDEAPDLASRLALLPSVIAAVNAIAYAHESKVVHRDLKPANIMVNALGDATVVDFGLARRFDGDDAPPDSGLLDDSAPTHTAAGMGTLEYASPEQIRGDRPNPHFDVYSLGATLHFVLSGKPAFIAETTANLLLAVREGRRQPLLDSVPPALSDIVAKAMHLDPAQRYATAAEMASDLKAYRDGEMVRARRYSRIERLEHSVRRNRSRLIAGTIVLTAAATSLLVFNLVRTNDRNLRARVEADRKASVATQDLEAAQKREAQANETARDTAEEAKRANRLSMDSSQQARIAIAAARKSDSQAAAKTDEARQAAILRDDALKKADQALKDAEIARQKQQAALDAANAADEERSKAVTAKRVADAARNEAETRQRQEEDLVRQVRAEAEGAKASADAATNESKRLQELLSQLQKSHAIEIDALNAEIAGLRSQSSSIAPGDGGTTPVKPANVAPADVLGSSTPPAPAPLPSAPTTSPEPKQPDNAAKATALPVVSATAGSSGGAEASRPANEPAAAVLERSRPVSPAPTPNTSRLSTTSNDAAIDIEDPGFDASVSSTRATYERPRDLLAPTEH